MHKQLVKHIIAKGEGIRTEFKESRSKLPKNLFESICAMLNRDGGDIILGVDDNGVITGVDKNKVDELTSNLVTLSNNPNKLDPPFILFPQVYERKGGEPQLIADIYNRKRNHYSEATIYPIVQLSDFNADLFTTARNLIRGKNKDHPWLSLSNEQLLHKAGLWKKDYASGKEGVHFCCCVIVWKRRNHTGYFTAL